MALILNGAAGKRDAKARSDGLADRLRPHVAELVVYTVPKGGGVAATAARAVADGAGILVALGGDGSQSAVANAVAGTGVVMGVLPGGTFNYFARDLVVGDTVDAAVNTLLGGHVRSLDVGAINGRIFLNNASFGLYPQILTRREEIYSRWGRTRIAAYWSVLLALRDMRDPMHMVLTVGGEQRDFYTPLAFAARSAFQLDSMGMDGAQAIREGHFVLYMAKGKRPLDLMKTALRLGLGRMARGQDFDLVVADDILIETHRRHRRLAFDGEQARMTGPFQLSMQRAGLSVIVPAPGAEAV
jgi:diacylglycerol kinase family enzyme